MDNSKQVEKRSRQAGNRGEEVVHWDGRNRVATGIAPSSKHTPSTILLSSSMTAHSVLSCTRRNTTSGTCWTIPYPPTDITTTRRTRKPHNHWRQQWRVRWTRWQFLYSRIDLFHSSLISPTLSRVYRLKTSILQVSPIYLWSLLLMSTRALSIWLYQSLKPVTSTIVGDIVTNSFSSLQHAYHAFTNSFSCVIKHAFPSRLTCLTHMFTIPLPHEVHVFASRPTHLLYLFKPVVRRLYSLAFQWEFYHS